MRIDAHQHFWRYTVEEFDWLNGPLAPLQRDWLPSDLNPLLTAAGVRGTVAVQARQTVEETRWLLQLAAQNEQILGVVGWADLRHEDFPEVLESIANRQKLCGLRHVVQGEPAGFMDGGEFNRGIKKLGSLGLSYDILIFAPQLEEATRLVDRHPNQIFVIDHIAKPDFTGVHDRSWDTALRELARRPNVTCKLSGIVTEVGPSWTRALLQPYFDTVFEAFGPRRLMAATDWPVLSPLCSYTGWWAVLESVLSELSKEEREEVEGGVATRTYGLYP
jgi:L-fuconolactonase